MVARYGGTPDGVESTSSDLCATPPTIDVKNVPEKNNKTLKNAKKTWQN